MEPRKSVSMMFERLNGTIKALLIALPLIAGPLVGYGVLQNRVAVLEHNMEQKADSRLILTQYAAILRELDDLKLELRQHITLPQRSR